MKIDRRAFTGSLVLTLFSGRELLSSIDLPTCPQDFEWKWAESIRAYVPCKRGWFFYDETDGTNHSVSCVKASRETKPLQEIGFHISSVRLSESFAENPQLSCYLLVHTCLSDIEPIDTFRSESEQFFRCGFEKIDPPKGDGQTPNRIRLLGIINKETMQMYLVQFETPVGNWGDEWPTGEKIFQMLELNEKL